MKIGLLSRNRQLYSTRRLIETAHARGHQVAIIDVMRAAVTLSRRPPRPNRRTRGRALWWWGLLPRVDAIIPRVGASSTAEGLVVVRFYEGQHVPTTASAEAIARSRRKHRSREVLAVAGLPMPRTVLVGNQAELREAATAVGGFPLLIKLNESTHGRGVWLVPNLATALAVQEVLQRRGQRMLVQEFIAEAAGTDIRLIIVGDRCVAAMERRAPAGEFRSNLHLGGTAVSIDPTPEMTRLAVQAAQAHGLAVAGVDLIPSQRGPLVLEVNSSPGLEGIEAATGQDVARAIVVHLEQLVQSRERQQQASRSQANRR